MAYTITLKKRAMKALENIQEPFYSNIKKAIYALAYNSRPHGYKKLKGRDAYRIRVAITELYMMFSTNTFWWM